MDRYSSVGAHQGCSLVSCVPKERYGLVTCEGRSRSESLDGAVIGSDDELYSR